jgi:homoserine O-acetyltransferase/O-succinyltransferase
LDTFIYTLNMHTNYFLNLANAVVALTTIAAISFISTANAQRTAHAVATTIAIPAPAPPKQISLGTCMLESGAAIQDCTLGVTTAGTLNAARDNAILFPTWYGGRSGDIMKYVGRDKLIDPALYFVIAVDSFGNGISSSPSTSKTQPGAAFPSVSLRDMTKMQARLLKEHFKLDTLHAVMGVSMGAMQTLEWAVWQPEIAKKFIAIAGSPRLAPFDIVFWETTERLLQTLIECQCQRPMQILAGMRFLMAGAQHQAKHAPHDMLEKIRADIAKNNMPIALAHDRILQMRAMIGHDVSRHTNGDLAMAAKRVGAKLMVVVGNQDNIVTPDPAIQFGRAAGGQTFEFATCGHDIPICQAGLINPTVRDFLSIKN